LGWKVIVSPNEVSIKDGEDENIIVSITSPENADADDSVDVSITATSTEDPSTPPAKATLLITYDVNQVNDVTLKPVVGEDTNKKVDPGSSIYFNLNVTNKGNGEDTIAISKEYGAGSEGWITIFSANQVTLDRDEWAIINISVTSPNDADAGQFQIDITATDEDETDTDTQTLIADVNYEPDFIVLPYGPNQKKVEPKESVIYGVTIQNKGNDEDTFEFEIRPGSWQGEGWSG
jgi:uncharacterized membrane protein